MTTTEEKAKEEVTKIIKEKLEIDIDVKAYS